ncbi:MAG: hypothetical protein HY962_15300 [Ignavibacteriae bacterium]|nr:hypothetical protein [Ignavibacteriota bacterium]
MNIVHRPERPARVLRLRLAALAFAAAFSALAPAALAQMPVDIARGPISDFGRDLTSRRISIYGVALGMSWGEARSILDRASIPYIFQKGTAPVVYLPPQNSSFYFVLNPSSYDVIEMGIIGPGELPVENQYLFDAQRWRLTTARVQFFGTEGEFIINEEGESYNFPFQGFVLKYLTPGSFRFVMVLPTNKPLLREAPPTPKADVRIEPERTSPPPARVQETPPPPAGTPLDAWIDAFAKARAQFENRDYTGALDAFAEIAKHAPDALLRVRSTYWMGESNFQLGQFKAALQNFQTVLKETDIETLRSPAKLMSEKCRRAMKG